MSTRKPTPEDLLEQAARNTVAGIDRVKVYQWFGVSFSSLASTPTFVTVEVETKSYLATKPKRTDFPDKETYVAASKAHREAAQAVALGVVQAAAVKLNKAGFYLRQRTDNGWPKLDVLKQVKGGAR